ncbi:MmcQ/YjbR family DNA-binding protein [Arthrobacter russicus]|jgi:predicted DNA-binding protein (MmcQ/YjbR family)|uniref:DNA-binding protein (MmcQ/YjbR family) n=1 Tax=Arthrobacter russicus TaxID=172040 RepID=A0ABU1JC31_9MICC|nr:MmcQ/YjbR family DNA-binding protein [Arthrobacter russicus]MBQ1443475.1 MmcQ/YjbR family DNA-binding protein [Renibacterium sp.]MDN5667876.1 MmcQ/YjbR family DNA-binding protein [Renibacterium salmoninarum]MDR6269446.1 putative DNA-binding protein (MmcQ/YjbR family) [Arthrobacter russicus]
MDSGTLRSLCLRLPGAFEDFPFGPDASVIKIAPSASAGSNVEFKMFALFRAAKTPLSVNLKCDPALAEQLRAAHPEITPGYHMNKKHWNTVDCTGGLSEQTIADLIEDSYDLVVASLPRPQREALGWTGLVERG